MRLPMNVAQFAGAEENMKPYEQFKDYYFHYMSEVGHKDYGAYDKSVSFAEKEAKMAEAMMSEIRRLSGAALDNSLDMRAWAQNPVVKWATAVTVDMFIEAVIPETVIRSMDVFTNIQTVGYGETATYEIEPNWLFTVSEGANAQRTTFRQKQFRGSKTLVPQNHDITVYTSLYRVLCGKESLAEFVRKAILSIETKMTVDAYGALTALINSANFPAQLKLTGYTQAGLLELAQKVQALNQGAKPLIVGTAVALSKIMPDSSVGYRIVTQSENMGIELIKNFYGFDVYELPQVTTGYNFDTVIDNNKLYIISTGSQKLIQGALEGSTTMNSNDYYENADLTSNATFNKRWVFEAISNAHMGLVTLQ